MIHGGNLRAARSMYGNHKYLDFSANINPLGIPDPIRNIWLQTIDTAMHYPDPNCEELCQAIAQMEQIPVHLILCGNGASELLFLAVAAKKPKRILLLGPCFVEYEQAAQAIHAEVFWHLLDECNDFVVQLEELPLDNIDMIIIGNPNNPTSQCVSLEIMNDLAQQCKQKEIDLLIDEAFIDLTLDQPTLIQIAATNEHVMVLRAFTKSLAIPGVRIGYAVGAESWLDKMKNDQLLWSVNVFAQNIAKVLPELSQYKHETQSWLNQELPYVYQCMQQLQEVKAIQPSTNFILWHLQKNNKELIPYLAREHHILIRDCSNYQGLGEGWFRTAIRLREENNRLFDALSTFLLR